MVAFKDAILAYALYYPAVELLSSVAIALVIWLGGFGVLRNAVSIGVLVGVYPILSDASSGPFRT